MGNRARISETGVKAPRHKHGTFGTTSFHESIKHKRPGFAGPSSILSAFGSFPLLTGDVDDPTVMKRRQCSGGITRDLIPTRSRFLYNK